MLREYTETKKKKNYFNIIRKIQALSECEYSDLPDS